MELKLSIAQQFQIEKFNREVDSCNDLETLREYAKKAFQAYEMQKVATHWAFGQSLSAPARVNPSDVMGI